LVVPNAAFVKLDVFPPSAVNFPTQLDRVETANLVVSKGKIRISRKPMQTPS